MIQANFPLSKSFLMNSEKMALKPLYPELLLQNKLTHTKTTNGVIWTNKEAQVFKSALSSTDYKKLLFFKILQVISLHGLPLLANMAIMVLISQMSNITLKIIVKS